ncbi:MAG: zf-HC2 domain-containing protein [Candidatus Aminicenantaceae bacterium]
MEHADIKKLIASYHEDVLDSRQKGQVEEHIRTCPECQKEFEETRKFEEVMGKMVLKKLPKETWEVYSTSVYNRLERGIGWIFMSIGAMILLFFGGYLMVEAIIQDPEIPLLLKVGILAVMAGAAVLLVSFGRERLFVDKRERYKEVLK